MSEDIDLSTDEAGAKNEALTQDQKNARMTFIEDVKWLVSSPRGRRLVWWLLEKAGVSRTSFNSAGKSELMWFSEGQRNMGLMLQAQVLEHAPNAYMTMIDEHKQSKK